MTRLEAAAFVDKLDAEKCWQLANALDALGESLLDEKQLRLVPAYKARVVSLLCPYEDVTEPGRPL